MRCGTKRGTHSVATRCAYIAGGMSISWSDDKTDGWENAQQRVLVEWEVRGGYAHERDVGYALTLGGVINMGTSAVHYGSSLVLVCNACASLISEHGAENAAPAA